MGELIGGPTPPEDEEDGERYRLVDIAEVMILLDRSESTIRRLEQRDPDFPKPLRFGGRRKSWLRSAVLEYLERKGGGNSATT